MTKSDLYVGTVTPKKSSKNVFLSVTNTIYNSTYYYRCNSTITIKDIMLQF